MNNNKLLRERINASFKLVNKHKDRIDEDKFDKLCDAIDEFHREVIHTLLTEEEKDKLFEKDYTL